jgi:hypothetical protein
MELFSTKLEPLELKFLLRLLEHSPDYRTRFSNVKPESKTPSAERKRICEGLCSKGLVEYTEEIQRYRIEPYGKTFVKADHSNLPISVSADELALLKAALSKSATPGQTKQIPTSDRQRLLHKLKEREFISITKSQIGTVWLTPQGIQYLLHDCLPESTRAKMTFTMVGHYLNFLRKSLDSPADVQAKPVNTTSLSAETILNTIRQLDQQLNTDNFLPIFHLREKLQPRLSREDLDRLLYELQGRDLIEFSTLQDVSNYSETEAAAGIPQTIGGALFYISVTE